MKKYYKLRNVALIFLAAVAISVVVFFIQSYQTKQTALASIVSVKDGAQWYSRALEHEQSIKQNPDNFDGYNGAFFNWKSLGDATQNEYFYRRGLRILKKADKYEKARSALFYVNAGNVFKILKEYENAEVEYKKATVLNAGDESMWLAYLDLYEHWSTKSPSDVIALYDKALSILVTKANVVVGKASYLASIGEYKDALALYQALYTAFPDQSALATKIQEIKYRMEQSQAK